MKKTKYFLLLFILSASVTSFAQEGLDTRGKEFWVTFLPNFHNNIADTDPRLKFGDSIYIFISSEVPTSGIIEFNHPGLEIKEAFQITDPTQIYIFKRSFWDYELRGFNESGIEVPQRDNEKITGKSFYVKSNDEITVYAHSQAVTTSDGCVVLPSHVMGNEYRVLAYNSHTYSEDFISSSTPSQFAIIASEDSTNVFIKLSARTKENGTDEQTIPLNRGDVYLVQADIEKFYQDADLTGTLVQSDKPVAIFAGHQRSGLPYNIKGGNVSRDLLFEQLLPTKYLGREYIVVPFVPGQNQESTGYDLFRVLAHQNNTEVWINGQFIVNLDAGQYYENILDRAYSINTSSPSIVGVYKKSAKFSAGVDFRTSDPLFIIMPAINQYHNFFRFINIQAYQFNGINYQRVYTAHHISIIYPDDIISMELDGVEINRSSANDIPGKYSYINLNVTEGVHTLKTSDKVGLTIYGYGSANSYGYLGGMSTIIIDHRPPTMNITDKCNPNYIMITDTAAYDSGIEKVEVVQGSLNNVVVTPFGVEPYQDTVELEVNIIDPYQDGSLEIVATDSIGFTIDTTLWIPGFTLGILPDNLEDRLDTLDHQMPVNKFYCFEVEISNYGRFTQKVDEVYLEQGLGGLFIKDPSVEYFILPGESVKIEVCYNPLDTGLTVDNLHIVGPCGDRDVMVIRIEAQDDDSPPFVEDYPERCFLGEYAMVTDTTAFDFGLKQVEVISTENCTFTSIEDYPHSVKYAFTLTDPYQDGFYTIRAVDSAFIENPVIHTDTIQGFTVVMLSLEGNNYVRFDENLIGSQTCTDLMIYNYGSLKHTFKEPGMFINEYFSVPLSQFPIEIEPNDSASITICFRPFFTSDEGLNDTFSLEFNCLDMSVPVEGLSREYIGTSESRCNLPVRVKVGEVPAYTYLLQNFPNPTNSTSIIMFGIPEQSDITLRIYDSYGNIRHEVLNGVFEAGEYDFQISTSEYSSGAYFYELNSGKERIVRRMVISK